MSNSDLTRIAHQIIVWVIVFLLGVGNIIAADVRTKIGGRELNLRAKPHQERRYLRDRGQEARLILIVILHEEKCKNKKKVVSDDSYDNDGNTTTSNNKTYTYNAWNQLIFVRDNGTGEGIKLLYDADGNRVAKIIGPSSTSNTFTGTTTATKYLVDTNNLTGYAQVVEELTEVNGLTVVTNQFTYGNDLISQRQLINGNRVTSFFGYDGHGSVRFLTDINGVVTDSYDYDSYGNLINQTGNTPNNYLYAGEQFDQDLNLYYNRARYLSTEKGRFWTQDSYEGNSEAPQSFHKYLYTANNPINLNDPSGYFDRGVETLESVRLQGQLRLNDARIQITTGSAILDLLAITGLLLYPIFGVGTANVKSLGCKYYEGGGSPELTDQRIENKILRDHGRAIDPLYAGQYNTAYAPDMKDVTGIRELFNDAMDIAKAGIAKWIKDENDGKPTCNLKIRYVTKVGTYSEDQKTLKETEFYFLVASRADTIKDRPFLITMYPIPPGHPFNRPRYPFSK